MFKNKIVSFIGAGAMGSAMIAGLIREEVTDPEAIIASDPLQEHLDELKIKYHIKTTTDNVVAARNADVVVLSVKPQRLEHVFKDLHGKLDPSCLVISIVAGMPIDFLAEGLNHPCIVRTMPNTPAQISEGITVWTCSSSVTEKQQAMTRRILQAFGEEVFVDEESSMDAATALSGTGPAYVFLFMEAMVDAGVHLGFSRKIAEKLVAQTVRGSVDFYIHSTKKGNDIHLAHMRNQVTSPGGTSAAALYYLEKAGFRTAISRAIWAAYERSVELGQGKKTRPPDNSK
ncbi:MAG: pyrroline-5-carboxylate reductase [Chloroflexota bacterium]|jgi:pyrroline-5-carboxylate reductase